MTARERMERLVLAAALRRDERAVDAWRAWAAASPPVDDLAADVHRLLPLLHANLEALGVRDPLVTRYGAVRRFYWVRNQALVRAAAPLVERWQADGLRMLALKGLALLGTYPRSELRPVGDIDVLVVDPDAERAVASLLAEGWTPKLPEIARVLAYGPPYFRTRHALPLRSPDGLIELDLHGRLHKALPSTAYARRAYDLGVDVTLGTVRTRALAPTDQLLHAVVHGLGSIVPQCARWLADAAVVLRAHRSDVDWVRLAEDAERQRVVGLLQRGLRAIADVTGEPLPDGAEALMARRPSPAERLAWAGVANEGVWRRRRLYVSYFGILRRADRADGRPRTGPVAYLQDVWALRERREVAAHALRAAGRALRRRAAPADRARMEA